MHPNKLAAMPCESGTPPPSSEQPLVVDSEARSTMSRRSFDVVVVLKQVYMSSIIALLFGFTISTCAGQTIPYSPLFAPNGSALCGTIANASVLLKTFYNTTMTSCALNCFTTTVSGSRCTSFNYDSSSLTCDVFSSGPGFFTTKGSCTYYQVTDWWDCCQRQVGREFFVKSLVLPKLLQYIAYSKQFQTKNVTNCSIPFTYNQMLYYDCAQVTAQVTATNAYSSGSSCDKLACISNGTLANCVAVPGFKIVNTTQLVSYSVISPIWGTITSNQTRKLPSVNGWLVVQQRINDSVNFNLTWANYTSGFGLTTIDNSFWAGLDLISFLNLQGYTRARFEMFSSVTLGWYSAEYSSFAVGSSASGYPLVISGYTGDAGDTMTSSMFSPLCLISGTTFATFDNSKNGTSSIAAQYGGGWWYPKNCLVSNLNGNYLTRNNTSTAMFWGVAGGSGPPTLMIASNTMPGSLVISRIMLRRP